MAGTKSGKPTEGLSTRRRWSPTPFPSLIQDTRQQLFQNKPIVNLSALRVQMAEINKEFTQVFLSTCSFTLGHDMLFYLMCAGRHAFHFLFPERCTHCLSESIHLGPEVCCLHHQSVCVPQTSPELLSELSVTSLCPHA